MSTPRRVMLISASIGEGHNAASEAIRTSLESRSPSVETVEVDALRVMGRWVSWLFRSIYYFEITRAPWVYQFFYDALWRHRWFERLAKRVVGSWCGRNLRREVRRFQPDLIVSTYPIGSAGLHWLRRHRHVDTPTCTYITDFAAHPFWVYPGVDVHCVMHEVSIADVRALGVTGPVWVVAPPVRPSFGPVDAGEARRALNLRTDAFMALVTGGAWGVGTLEEAIRGLLELNNDVQVVVACGKNEALLHRLLALGAPSDRLVPLGYTDRMPVLMAAANAVVTNAGGVTSLEAFTTNRPLILFDPIAGHGRANAALMERARLAVVCPTTSDLQAEVSRIQADPAFTASILTEQQKHLVGKALVADLDRLGAFTPQRTARWRKAGRRLSRVAAAAALLLLLIVQGSLLVGTHLAHAARGASPSSDLVAIAVVGSLQPGVLRAVGSLAQADHIPTTFFVEGQDVLSQPGAVRALAARGFEIEAGTWSSLGRWSVELGDLRAELLGTANLIRAATGIAPRYIANPGGRFSLFAIAATDSLHLRRVVFGQVVQAGARQPAVPTVRPGTIIGVRIPPSASPGQSAALLGAVAAKAQSEGLKAVTVSQIDRAGPAGNVE